ncbi:hypothetical protein HMPREF9520_00645 [Enterococcus faecalis TX1467]|nr:hypothetical protein HMPREF9520_00645 [Enterococcus faecalis TX1467]
MSVRVNDLLKLPSLREATVLSGKNQLDTSVASLSFLEVSDMSLFSEKLHKTNGIPCWRNFDWFILCHSS